LSLFFFDNVDMGTLASKDHVITEPYHETVPYLPPHRSIKRYQDEQAKKAAEEEAKAVAEKKREDFLKKMAQQDSFGKKRR